MLQLHVFRNTSECHGTKEFVILHKGTKWEVTQRYCVHTKWYCSKSNPVICCKHNENAKKVNCKHINKIKRDSALWNILDKVLHGRFLLSTVLTVLLLSLLLIIMTLRELFIATLETMFGVEKNSTLSRKPLPLSTLYMILQCRRTLLTQAHLSFARIK